MKPARGVKKQDRPETSAKAAIPADRGGAPYWVQAMVGLWLGIAVMKFGNPAILDNLVATPTNLLEFIFTPWPLMWGYFLTLIVLGIGLAVLKPRKAIHPLMLVLSAWLLWQFASGARSIDLALTAPTVMHFCFLVAICWFGFSCMAKLQLIGWFWTPLILCFAFVLWTGLEQHYGGLEATRRAIYEQPDWRNYPPEFLAKIATNRIFGTLFYPNALAGLILFLGPVASWALWSRTVRWPRMIRSVCTGLFIFACVACLYWTGSKGGWLLAIVLAGVVFLHAPLPKVWKIGASALIVVLGLAGFLFKYGGYLKKGAPSASARVVYWQSGLQILKANPVFGTGPGTFGTAYKQIKPPEAEMARLTHNDYLQQFTDSGIPGGLAFLAFMGGFLYLLYRERMWFSMELQLLLLGLAAYGGQSLIEFNLYLPALAWPFFLFAGYLLGRNDLGRPENVS